MTPSSCQIIAALWLIIYPLSGAFADNDTIRPAITDEERALLKMTPAEILEMPLSPQSVNAYWEKHGVTSVSKRGEDPFDTPSALYVITSEDIQRSGATTIPEILRQVPGLHVARIDNNKWALSIRGFMRQFASNLLVAVDGVTIHTPSFSGVWWDVQDIVLEDIERIEVIRGPGSTLWGRNAVSGVINIITKHTKHTHGTYVSALMGNEEDGTFTMRYGGRIDKKTNYRISAKQAKRDGATPIDGSELNNTSRHVQSGFRIDKKISFEDSWTLSGSVFDNISRDMFPVKPSLEFAYTERVDGTKESQGGNVVSRWVKNTPDVKTTLQSYISYDRYKITPVLKVRGYTFDMDLQQDRLLDPAGEHQLSWGLEYRFYQDVYDGTFPIIEYTPNKRKENFFSFFIQNRYGLIPNKLYGVVGSKVEHNSYTGLEVQPTARLSWYADNKQSIWASVSRPVRTPNRAERSILLLQNKATSNGYLATRGSPHYDSEYCITYEIGHRYRPKPGLTFDSTAFYNNYHDLRAFSPVTSPHEDFASLIQAFNKGEADAYGLELTAEWQIMPKWRVEGSYSLFHIDYKEVENMIFEYDQGAPKNLFNLQSYYEITPNLSWNILAYYGDNIPKQNISASLRVDSNIQWRMTDKMMLSINGINLFDEQEQEFNTVLYAVPAEIERSLYAKLSWGF